MIERETELKKIFTTITLFILKNNCSLDCNKIRDQLFMLDFLNLDFLNPKQVFICFKHLVNLHSSGEIPVNVFWISCADIGPKDKNIVPGHFRENMYNIFTSIKQSGFDLDMHLSEIIDEDIWFFVLFKKKEGDKEYFSAILQVVKNHNNLISFEELIKN
jgi:hypothetical protein